MVTFNMLLRSLLIFFVSVVATHAFASEDPKPEADSLMLQLEMLYRAHVDSILNTFIYETGSVSIGNGLAMIEVPEGYSYISPENAKTLLVDIWGNPPTDRSLGILLPTLQANYDNLDFAVDINYITEGYVNDDDAKDLDYDDLLEQMQEDTEASNEYRIAEGYDRVKLVGWASAPFYDANRNRLHFAKELAFGEEEIPSLNYNVQFLNRYGYLEYNVIGEMEDLPKVEENLDYILNSVNFSDGQRYADFDSSIDKVAAYGIGGLIAGKLLLKAGLLAKVGLFLAKGWKIIVFGLIAVGSFIKRLFTGKGSEG